MNWDTVFNSSASPEDSLHPHVEEEQSHLYSAFTAGSCEIEVLDYLYASIRLFKPTTVFETGTGHGHSTAAIALALARNGFGSVISVESDACAAESARATLDRLEVSDRCTIICSDSLDFIRSLDFSRRPSFDFALFDSSIRVRPLEYWELHRRGGLSGFVAFHDTSRLREHSLKVPTEPQNVYLSALDHIERSACTGHIESPNSRGFRLFQLRVTQPCDATQTNERSTVFLSSPHKSLGDQICFLSAARLWAAQHPGLQVVVDVLPEVVRAFDDTTLSLGHSAWEITADVEARHRVKHTSPDRNYVGTYLAGLGGLVPGRPTGSLPSFPRPKHLPLQYIALQPLSGWAPNPPRAREFVQHLVDAIRSALPTIPIVAVGNHDTDTSIHGISYRYTGASITTMLSVIQHSAAVLSPRSATAHIAAAYKTPSFLWLPDDGENWHLDYPNWNTSRISINSLHEDAIAAAQRWARSLFPASQPKQSRSIRSFSGGALISMYFTSRADPQRGSAVPRDHFPYIERWYNSVRAHSLSARIIHDGLSPAFVSRYETRDIRFVKTNITRNPVDAKWEAALQILSTTEVDRVFITDISDVEVRSDPFSDFTMWENGRLFCGDERDTLNHPWMLDLASRIHPQWREWCVRNGEITLLNPGVFGGRKRWVQLVVASMLRRIRRWSQPYVMSDILFFNVVLRSLPPRSFSHGAPINSVFKAFEDRSDVWFAHK